MRGESTSLFDVMKKNPTKFGPASLGLPVWACQVWARQESNLGRPDERFRELDDVLTTAGAWQPWKGPALSERLRRAQAVNAQWKQAVIDELVAQMKQLPSAAEPVVLQSGVTQVRVGALKCTNGTCMLALELENLSDEPLERVTASVPQEAFDQAQLLSATGAVIDLNLGAGQPDAGLAANSRTTVKLKTWWDPRGNGAPRLLRVHTPFGWKVLRLREPSS